MMITPLTIYWITRLDGIVSLVIVLSIMFALASFTCFVFGEDEVDIGQYKKAGILFLFLMCLCLLLKIFIPSTNEMAAIIVLPPLINNEDIQSIGHDLPKLAREYLEDLRKKD